VQVLMLRRVHCRAMRTALLVGVVLGLLFGAVAIGAALTTLEPVAVTPIRPTPVPIAPPTPSPSAQSSLEPTPVPSTGVGLGNLAPPLTLAGLGDSEIDLAALKGTPVWVAFTASWCPTCRDELGLMERFAQANPGVTLLVVDVKEPSSVVEGLVESTGITMPVGIDTDGAAQVAWNAYALPVHFFVDKDGIVREFIYGGPGPDQFLAGLQTILPDAKAP